MPAVESPDPGVLTADELQVLVSGVAPYAVGAEVTVFDPDLDPDGRYEALRTPLLAEVSALVPDPECELERLIATKYAGSWVAVEPPGTMRFACGVEVERITSQRGAP